MINRSPVITRALWGVCVVAVVVSGAYAYATQQICDPSGYRDPIDPLRAGYCSKLTLDEARDRWRATHPESVEAWERFLAAGQGHWRAVWETWQELNAHMQPRTTPSAESADLRR